MAGRVQWEAQVDSNVAKLLSETKELRDQLDGIKKGNYEIKLNIDDKKLEKVISNLDKMLNSLGKGTGDFKEFENLSKQLNEIVSEVKELNKAFSGINDSGVSNLLSSIQSIDKSLSSLSEHITNVNKDFGSVGKNASDNVGQINEARKATEGLTEATKELANAQKNVGNKSNISSGNSEDLKVIVDTLTKLSNLNSSISLGKIMTEAVKGTKIANEELLNILQTLRLVDKEGKVIAQHITEGTLNSGVELTDKFAIISRNDAIENLDLLIAKEKEAEEQGVILAKTLASVDVGKLHYDIQELAQGQSVHKMKDSSLENFIKETEILCKATDEQILKLYSDAQKLSDLGFKLDLNPSNLRYDEKSGFSFIDLELRKINEDAPETISIIHTLTQSLMGFMGQRNRLNWDDENSFYTQDNLSYLQNMLKTYERLKVVFSEKLDTPTFNNGFIDSYELVLSRLKELEKHFEKLGVSTTPIEDTFQGQTPEIDKATNSVNELVEAEKELVEVSKQAQKIDLSNLGHTDNSQPANVEKYQQSTTRAPRNSKLLSADNKLELGTELKRLQTEIIASLDETTTFVKEVTDFYDSQNNLVKTQMKVLDKNNSMRTYTTSYSVDKEGNANTWTSHITTEKIAEAKKAEEKAIKEVQAQKDAFHKKNLNAIDMEIKKREEESSAYAKTLKSQMEERYSAISSMEKSLNNYNSKLEKFSVKPADGNRYPVYQQQIDSLTKKIGELDTLKNNLSKKDIIDESDMKSVNALQQEIDELILKMNNMSAGERGFDPLGADKALEKINSELKKNSAMSKEAKRQIQGFYDEIRSGNPSKPIKDLLDDMYKLIQAERLAGREGKSFMDIFKEKVVYGAAANMAGMIGIYDIINVGRQAVDIVIDLNTQITELAKVSEATSSQIYDDFNSYAEIAKDIGGTISDTISATSDWSRNGYSIPDSKELAKVALLYKNVGDGIDIDTANESLISTLRGFRMEAEDAMHIIDVFNEVDTLASYYSNVMALCGNT